MSATHARRRAAINEYGSIFRIIDAAHKAAQGRAAYYAGHAQLLRPARPSALAPSLGQGPGERAEGPVPRRLS
jgi:hypothetical protein